MRIEIQWTDGKVTMWEPLEIDTEICVDETQAALDKVEWFNSLLLPDQRTRELLATCVMKIDSQAEHKWVRTSMYIQPSEQGGRAFDPLVCSRCAITARRYLGSDTPTLDRKYTAKAYIRCDTAQVHVKRLAVRRESSRDGNS